MKLFANKRRLSKKLMNLAKKRDLYGRFTRKLRKGDKRNNHILNHPSKFLKMDELYLSKGGYNDILKYAKHFSHNVTKHHKKFTSRIKYLKSKRGECVRQLNKKKIEKNRKQIHKYHRKHKELLDTNMDYYVYKEFGSQYENYKISHYCDHYDVLNIDRLMKHFEYFDITHFDFNPSKTCFSFCIDFVGNRNYHFFVKDIYEDKVKYIPLHRKNEYMIDIHNFMARNSSIQRQLADSYFWVNDNTILYISNNASYNSSSCYTMNIRNHKRKLVYQNQESRQLSLREVHSEFYYLLYSSTYHSDEVYVLDIQDHNVKCIQTPVLKNKSFVLYHYIDHIHATWYILKQDKETFTFLKTTDYRHFDVLFVKKDKYLDVQDVDYMNETFVFFFKIKGSMYIELYFLCDKKIKKLRNTTMCDTKNSCSLRIMKSIPDENRLFFYSSSFTKQNRLFVLEITKTHDYDMNELNVDHFDSSSFIKKHMRANTKFCEEVVYLKQHSIMITKIYKKGLNLNNCKCILYGYGAYGDHYDATFNANQILVLCERGFLVVLSQISGDGALGFQQRYNGMLRQKENTFLDFIYIIENYLFKENITSKDKLLIWGRSAGGLLIGAVLNMRPDICRAAIMGVPFVTPILTMSSDKNPLGFESHSEFGNPLHKGNMDYIQSYSPFQNIDPNGDYPHLFIYSNLNDTLVPYNEPLMYYKSLKQNVEVFKENKKDLYLHIEDKFGHNQGSSLKDKEYQQALLFTFIEKYIH